MKQNILGLVTELNVAATCENPLDKADIIACAIGLTTAIKLGTLPSSEVKVPGEQYVTSVKTSIEEVIYKLNESIIFNREKACSIARAFWMFRYNTVYGDLIYPNFGGNDIICNVTQAPRFFSVEDYGFMTKHTETIRKVMTKVSDILTD